MFARRRSIVGALRCDWTSREGNSYIVYSVSSSRLTERRLLSDRPRKAKWRPRAALDCLPGHPHAFWQRPLRAKRLSLCPLRYRVIATRQRSRSPCACFDSCRPERPPALDIDNPSRAGVAAAIARRRKSIHLPSDGRRVRRRVATLGALEWTTDDVFFFSKRKVCVMSTSDTATIQYNHRMHMPQMAQLVDFMRF